MLPPTSLLHPHCSLSMAQKVTWVTEPTWGCTSQGLRSCLSVWNVRVLSTRGKPHLDTHPCVTVTPSVQNSLTTSPVTWPRPSSTGRDMQYCRAGSLCSHPKVSGQGTGPEAGGTRVSQLATSLTTLLLQFSPQPFSL